MKYQVQIMEEITETRSVEVEADSPTEAHRLAYEQWVEQGEAELESTAVNAIGEARADNATPPHDQTL